MSPTQQRRHTIYDIASLAGVSHTTVSRALNNRPEILPATRSRILSIAHRLGYRRDPMLTALSAYKRQSKTPPITATLAYLKDSAGQPRGFLFADTYLGAKERAEDLGYHLDLIWARQPGLNSRRLSDILTSRGIEGIIVSPLLHDLYHRGEINLDWNRFASVTIGYSLQSPQIHRVCDDYFFAVNEVITQIYSRGYRRPCLFMPRFLHERNNHRWLAAYLMCMERQPKNRKGIHYIPDSKDGQSYPAIFREWWDGLKQKPDALIFVDTGNAGEFLRGTGWSYPEDMGVAVLNKDKEDHRYSGILVQASNFGEVAVSFLVSLLHANEKGIPKHPKTISVPGVWSEGKSLRKAIQA